MGRVGSVGAALPDDLRADVLAMTAMQAGFVAMVVRTLLRAMPLLGALLRLQDKVDRLALPSARELRAVRRYWRECRRAQAEFAAAFPNWQSWRRQKDQGKALA